VKAIQRYNVGGIGGVPVITLSDHRAALAEIEKRVEGLKMTPPNVGYGDGWQDWNSALDAALTAIKGEG